MKYIGIDWGEKRVGVAHSDADGVVAFPLCTLPADARLTDELKRISVEKNAEAFVVGESLDFSGARNPVMARIVPFTEKLHAETGLPVYFEREFLTSSHADTIQGAKAGNDASAAALILQRYLDRSGRKLPDSDDGREAEE